MRKKFKQLVIITMILSLILSLTVGINASSLDKTGELKSEEEEEAEEVQEEDRSEEDLEDKKEENQEEDNLREKESKDKKEVEDPEEGEKGETSEKEKIKDEKEEVREEKMQEDYDELAENIPPVMNNPFISIPMKVKSSSENNDLEDTIEVDKCAERIYGACRAYQVNLKITGKAQEAPVDVVMVIDKSGSMNESTTRYVPITDEPNSNQSYYVKINEEYQIVSYHSGNTWRYRVRSGWIGSTTYYVKWDPNGDDNSGGSQNSNNLLGKPFYLRETGSRLHFAKEAAVNFSAKVLGSGGISGSRVSLVTFSGPSTIYGSGNQNQAQTVRVLTSNLNQLTNDINGITAIGGTNTEAGFLEGREVIENSCNPNSNKVVIMFTDGLPTASNGNRYAESTDVNHIHNQRALAAGKGIYQDGVADVFTIGLLQGMSNTERNLALHILKETQNKGWYEAPTAADLDQIFDDISTQLAYGAQDAKVVDKIGDNFNLVEGSLPVGASYNPRTREISWNPRTIVEEAELSYKVRAKPKFPGGLADTNEYAKLTYTDVFGDKQTKDFPVPEVNVPSLLEVSLTGASITLGDSINLGRGTDPAGENYMSEITGGDGDGTYTYQWRVKGEDEIISTDKNPEVSPTEDTEYELTVIDSNGCTATATITVRVNEKSGKIIISKEVEDFDEMMDLDFFGIQDKSELSDRKFEIKIIGPNNYEKIIELKHDESKTLEELELGEYTVEEINMDGKFKLVNINTDEFELTDEDPEVAVQVRNKINFYQYGIKKVDEDGNPLPGAEFELSQDGISQIIESDKDGISLFNMLQPGDYVLKERKAPEGYRLDDREIMITINEDGRIYTDPHLDRDSEDSKLLVIENIRILGLPETGGGGTIVFTLVGILLMVAAYFLYDRKYE